MIRINVSSGELVDKITILKIKKNKINNANKIRNISKELAGLIEVYESFTPNKPLEKLEVDLFMINNSLWDIEDKLRDYERNKNFGCDFVELSRSVYKLNDQRFNLKSQINTLTNSDVVEEKSYSEYL